MLVILSLLLSSVAWGVWPVQAASATVSNPVSRRSLPTARLRALYLEYGLVAVGLVPHMLFLVDFVALGLGAPGLIVSSIFVGAFVPGIVPLVLGRIQELLAHHPAAQKAAWSKATTTFAVFQAAAAYGLSFLFVQTNGNYRLLFVLGGMALALAHAVDLVVAVVSRDPADAVPAA